MVVASIVRPFSDVDLNAFIDNQVSPDRREVIAAYLKTAPADFARVENWRRQNEAIRTVFTETAAEPVPVWLTIGQLASNRDRVAAERIVSGKTAAQIGIRRFKSRSGLGWKLAAVAIGAFASGFALPTVAPKLTELAEWWTPMTSRAEVMERFSRRALDAHTTYSLDVDGPVEVAGEALPKWFKRRLAFPVRIPDLQSVGWMLLGGRIAPGTLGPSALLVYENALGERLSLYTGRVANPSLYETSYELNPDHVLTWMDGPIGFAIATSKSGAWLTNNARDLYRAAYGVSDG